MKKSCYILTIPLFCISFLITAAPAYSDGGCNDLLRLAVYDTINVKYDWQLSIEFERIKKIRDIIKSDSYSDEDLTLITNYGSLDYGSEEANTYYKNFSFDLKEFYSEDEEVHLEVTKKLVNSRALDSSDRCMQSNTSGVFSKSSYKLFSVDENLHELKLKYNRPVKTLPETIILTVAEAENIKSGLKTDEKITLSTTQSLQKSIEINDISKNAIIKLRKKDFPEVIYEFKAITAGYNLKSNNDSLLSDTINDIKLIEDIRYKYWRPEINDFVRRSTGLKQATEKLKKDLKEYLENFEKLRKENSETAINKMATLRDINSEYQVKLGYFLEQLRQDFSCLIPGGGTCYDGFARLSYDLKVSGGNAFAGKFHGLLKKIVIRDQMPSSFSLYDILQRYDAYKRLAVL